MKIIAEIGWNHMGEATLAEDMIAAASDSGANVVKFQYWNPDYLKPGVWDDDGRREIYNKAALNEEKIIDLIKLSDKYNCEFLISVFGTIGAKLMADLGQTAIKIPSHETTNLKLIEFCSNNFSQIYFSAGASTETEIIRAVDILRSGTSSYNLMHCVSSYPCPNEKINLSRLSWLSTLSHDIGFSDHTKSTVIPAISVIYGATAIEKHFTTDNNLPGRDNANALEPKEFKEMVININESIASLIPLGRDYQDIEADTVQNYRGRWEPHDYE
jgi:sialic acid synthase SpsE